MTKLLYRSTVYRGVYAATFVCAYLLLAAYLLAGDNSDSESSAGVWRLLIGMALAGVAGTVVGPALHRRLFKYRAPHRPAHKTSKHAHDEHSHS